MLFLLRNGEQCRDMFLFSFKSDLDLLSLPKHLCFNINLFNGVKYDELCFNVICQYILIVLGIFN